MPKADAGWSVVIDRESCIGSGLCVAYAPGTFEHDDEAKATLRNPTTEGLDEVRTAVEACPMGALQLSIDERETT
jgi:ferredoxin